MNITQLADTIVTALQMKNETYKIEHSDKQITIKWKHHKVVLQWKYIWFDGQAQYSVYNIISAIKAGK